MGRSGRAIRAMFHPSRDEAAPRVGHPISCRFTLIQDLL